jgi:hypothetical protein
VDQSLEHLVVLFLNLAFVFHSAVVPASGSRRLMWCCGL